MYAKMSRYHNYRARSAYKLIQIDDKYKLLKPGMVVIDAGAAPGSWTQVICERLKLNEEHNKKAKSGICLAIDLAAIEPIDGAICLGNADVTSPFTQAKLLSWLDNRKVDCIFSDMSPNATGQKFVNHTRIVKLVDQLLSFAVQILKPGTGVFLAKIFAGDETERLEGDMRGYFADFSYIKPDASRGDSTELYVLGRKFGCGTKGIINGGT